MFRIRSSVLVAALLVAVPATAEAQFAGVPRAPRRRPAADAVASGRDSTRRDTLPPTRLPDMKAWVDSATIALGASGGSGAGTSTPAASPTRSAKPSAPAGRAPGGRGADSTMRDGARAPNTATPLPSIALAGSLFVAVGLFIRRRAASRG